MRSEPSSTGSTAAAPEPPVNTLSPDAPPAPTSTPTAEELEEFRARLRAAGVDTGEETGAPSWRRMQGRDLGQLPTLARQREIMEQLAAVVRGELAGALAELEAARSAAVELRHGGGR